MNRESETDIWTLPRQPMWINISGPRFSTKHRVAGDLAAFFANSEFGINERIFLFLPGNLTRFAAEDLLLKRPSLNLNPAPELSPEQFISELTRTLRWDNSWEQLIKTRVAEAPFPETALDPSRTVLHSHELEHCERYVPQDRAISGNRFSMARLEFLTTLIGRGSRVLRERRQELRRELQERATLVIGAHPGHMPTAQINFFLLVPQELRGIPSSVGDLGKPLLEQNEKDTRDRLETIHEIAETEDALLVDPAARLTRYPGHFIPVWKDGPTPPLEVITPLAISGVRQHHERKNLESELLQLFRFDRASSSDGKGTFSLLMIKGGGPEALYGPTNSALLRRLSKDDCFRLCLGASKHVSLQETIQRWPDAVTEPINRIKANFPQLESESDGDLMPRVLRELLEDLKYGLETLDHWRLSIWLSKLQLIRETERTRIPMASRRELSKIFAFIAYVLAPSQYVLLRRVLPRAEIISFWRIEESYQWFETARKESLKRVENHSGLEPEQFTEWKNCLSLLDEQSFVKLILVGDIEEPGTLRNVVWEVLQSRPVLWPRAVKEEDLSLKDLAKIMNGVHGPNGPQRSPQSGRRELQEEMALLSTDDIVRFSCFMQAHLQEGSR